MELEKEESPGTSGGLERGALGGHAQRSWNAGGRRKSVRAVVGVYSELIYSQWGKSHALIVL